MILEIGTTNYSDDLLCIKKAMSHMESLLGAYNGYTVSDPSERFGWTFFKMVFRPDLRAGIEDRFADMLARYRSKDPGQRFAEFVADYLDSKGCKVRVSVVPGDS